MHLARICTILALLLPSGSFAQNMPAKPVPEQAADGRYIVALTEAESALVAAKMRQMLASVQGVASGLALNGMKAVHDAASRSGMAMDGGSACPGSYEVSGPVHANGHGIAQSLRPDCASGNHK